MKKNILLYGVVSIGLALFIYGIVGRYQQENRTQLPDTRMQVVASFYPLAHIAQHIGKEYVHVLNVTPAGSEPHDFDPSPRDIADLQDADVFIYNGAGFEPWVSRILPELEQKGVRVFESTKGFALLAGDEHGHEDEHEEDSHEEEVLDPHVWLDPVLVRDQVQSIATVFAELDSARAGAYRENASVYSKELAMLDDEFALGLAKCERRDIVTAHAAFGYLAKRYNLNMIPIGGLSPDAEPSPARLAEISTLVREKGITHIFFETLVSPKIAETIANETGVQTASLNPLEGLTQQEEADGKTYVSVQRENLQALKIALGCI